MMKSQGISKEDITAMMGLTAEDILAAIKVFT